MSQSRFMILLGSGNHFSDNGLQPHGILSLYDDKGAWVFDRFGQPRRLPVWFSDRDSVFDDAFLMISLYMLGPELRRTGKGNLFILAKKCFRLNLFERDARIRMYNNESISDEERFKLYNKNRETLHDYAIKLVTVLLGAGAIQIGGMIVNDNFKDEFIETAEQYSLKHLEICQCTHAKFYGAFDAVEKGGNNESE